MAVPYARRDPRQRSLEPGIPRGLMKRNNPPRQPADTGRSPFPSVPRSVTRALNAAQGAARQAGVPFPNMGSQAPTQSTAGGSTAPVLRTGGIKPDPSRVPASWTQTPAPQSGTAGPGSAPAASRPEIMQAPSESLSPQRADVAAAETALAAAPATVTPRTVEEGTGQLTYAKGDLSSQATVEGRLNSLMSRDNPYLQQARTRALQQMNARGLTNSSMAMGAVEAARLDAALPIAQQDAQSAFQNDQTNLGYENEQRKLNAGTEVDLAKYNTQTQNDTARFNTELQQQNAQFNAGNETDTRRFNVQALNQAASQFAQERNRQNFEVLQNQLKAQLSRIDTGLQKELDALQHQYKLDEQMDAVMGKAYQQLVDAIGRVSASAENGEIAAEKIKFLLDRAGATFEFTSGKTIDLSSGGDAAGGGGNGSGSSSPGGIPRDDRIAKSGTRGDSGYLSRER